MTDTQTKYKDYFDHLNRIYEESFPVKSKKVHYKTLSKPWINKDLQKLIKKKNKLYSLKAKRKNSDCNKKDRDCKKDLAEKLTKAKRDYYHKKLYTDVHHHLRRNGIAYAL